MATEPAPLETPASLSSTPSLALPSTSEAGAIGSPLPQSPSGADAEAGPSGDPTDYGLPQPPVLASLSPDEQQEMSASLKTRHKRRVRGKLEKEGSKWGRRHADSDDEDEEFDPSKLHELSRETACALEYKHIELVAGDKTVHSEVELPRITWPEKTRYIWEVMYENQRGISLFGRAWYSSNSLLPSDPSPFTLPLTLPGSDFTVSNRMTDERRKEPPLQKRKTIKTAYNLHTYQTPSPAWLWLTPWMVNMRSDTDEQGWRYNLWFHRKGWRSHSGYLNWWGWVRRREWVRLRALLPEEGEYGKQDEHEEEEPREVPKTLDEVLDTPRPVENIARTLAMFALDREKLHIWHGWLDQGSEAAVEKLKAILKEPGMLAFLSRAIIYSTGREALSQTLQKRGLVDETQCRECALEAMEIEE